jgi:hypothetical protein
MTDRSFDRCKTCGDYDWIATHKCKPMWEVRINEPSFSGPPDEAWDVIHANNAEEAAEKFCEHYDSGSEYVIVTNGGTKVEVRKRFETETTIWDIEAESRPHYRASKI